MLNSNALKEDETVEMDYVFMTDSDSDLPFHLKEEYDIPVVYMPYALDGKEYFDDLGQTLDHKSYYDKCVPVPIR